MKRLWRKALCAVVAATWISSTGAQAVDATRIPSEVMQRWKTAADRASQFDWAGAVVELDAVLAALPNQPQALVFRGDMNLRMQRWSLADADFSRAIEIYGTDKRAARPLIQRSNLRQKAHPDASLNDIERAISIDPEYAEARYEHAAALWRRGRSKEALEESARSVALDPNNGLYHQLRGMVLMSMDDLPGAKVELDISVQRAPQMFTTWSSRAALKLRMGDFSSAREDANHALTLFPDAPRVRLTIAMADALLGNVTIAATSLREIAGKRPAELSPRAAIAGAAPDEILERLVRDGVHAARAELAWGLVCRARSEPSDAERHFAAALERDSSFRASVEIARSEVFPR